MLSWIKSPSDGGGDSDGVPASENVTQPSSASLTASAAVSPATPDAPPPPHSPHPPATPTAALARRPVFTLMESLQSFFFDPAKHECCGSDLARIVSDPAVPVSDSMAAATPRALLPADPAASYTVAPPSATPTAATPAEDGLPSPVTGGPFCALVPGIDMAGETDGTPDPDVSLPVVCASPSADPIEIESGPHCDRKPVPDTDRPMRVPWPFRLRSGYSSPAVFGSALDSACRGSLIMSNVFIGKALLDLAKIAAGCSPVAKEPCKNRIYGFFPSSLLTNMLMTSSLFNATFMPLVGAVVDHTSYRRAVGLFSTYLLVILNGLLFFIRQDIWLYMVLVQMLGGFAYLMHAVVSLAYLPELTPDRKKLAEFTADFNILQYLGSFSFIAVVTAVSQTRAYDNLATVRLSQILVVTSTTLLMGLAWIYFLPKRETLSAVPEGSWLLTAGFRKIGRTTHQIFTKFDSLKWMLMCLLFAEAAANSFPQIAITFTDEILGLDQKETGMVMGILLLMSVPGSFLSMVVSNHWNPKVAYQLSLLLLMLTMLTASYMLRSKDDKHLVYYFGAAWGVGFGWLFPSQRTLYVTIIPKRQEAEMMGLYIFTGQALLFLPPLIFSALNESSYSMNYGVACLGMFFFVGFAFTLMMGRYEKSVAAVNPNYDEEGVILDDSTTSL